MQQFALGTVTPVTHPEGTPWYDDKAWITLALLDLESLEALIMARNYAGYKQNQRLNEFYIFGGRWALDTCGNVMRATADPLPEVLRTLIPVATKTEFWDFHRTAREHGLIDSESISFAMKSDIPPSGMTCMHCKKPWSITNIYDCTVTHNTEVIPLADFVGQTLAEVKHTYAERIDARYRMQPDILIRNDKHIDLSLKYPNTEKSWEKDVAMNQMGWLATSDGVTDDRIIEVGDEGFFNRWQYFHIACRDAHVAERTKEEFDGILREAGYSDFTLMPCRNEYGSVAYRGPWYLFSYKGATIRVGWRKRVIEIDWSRVESTELRTMIAKLFADVESTHTNTIVHANNANEATKFLSDIRTCLDEYGAVTAT